MDTKEAIEFLKNKIWDILKNLSINYDQIDNYSNQWKNYEFYLDYVNYDGREVMLEEILDMIMTEIKSGD